jgi:AmiR/NasT family two-component response regulator
MGITAQHNTVLFDQAYQLMRRHARNNNTRLRSVAEVIVAARRRSLPRAFRSERGCQVT